MALRFVEVAQEGHETRYRRMDVNVPEAGVVELGGAGMGGYSGPDGIVKEQENPLALKYRARCEERGRPASRHTLRTIGGVIIRTATHGQNHCGDVPVLTGGAVRFYGIEGDGGVYLEAWGHQGRALGQTADYLRRHGWDVATSVALDGCATVVTAWHRVGEGA